MPVYSLQQALQDPQAVTSLYLDRIGLQVVPEQLRQCTRLRHLDLSGNAISYLPDWLPKLPCLETLILRKNLIKNLRQDWSGFRSLRKLELSNNHLTSIRGTQLPESLQELNLSNNRLQTLAVSVFPPALRRLDVSHNSLRVLPDLRACPELYWLQAYHNRLKTWPSLPSALQWLDLGHNQLAALPQHWSAHRALQFLSLAQNAIPALPAGIGQCSSLRELDLSGNQLTKLPAGMAALSWLVKLSLNDNQLEQIPVVIQQLDLLDELSLAKNALRRPVNLSGHSKLRRLDLSHNPIPKIIGLPANLQSLRAKSTQLSAWTFLRKLPALQELELDVGPEAELLDDICHLGSLQQLRGVLPYGKKQKLLRLLQEPLEATTKRHILDKWILGKTTEGNTVIGQQMLTTQISALRRLGRKELLQATASLAFPAVEAIQIFGKLSSVIPDLQQALAASGVTLHPAAEVIVLGRAPYPDFLPGERYTFFSEAQLLAFLRKQDQNDTLWAPQQVEQLQRRLLHPNPQQVKLAALLLTQEPIPPKLLPGLILAGKLQQLPRLKRQLLELAHQSCTPQYEALLHIPLQLQAHADQQAAIRQWGQKAQLPAAQLDELLRFF